MGVVGLVGVGISIRFALGGWLETGLIHGGFLRRELMGAYFYGTALYLIRVRRTMNE